MHIPAAPSNLCDSTHTNALQPIFRSDDFVFFIYLYQRWCYGTDSKRVNEYGQVEVTKVEVTEGTAPASSSTATPTDGSAAAH